MKNATRRRQAGFTLIEVLLVIGILLLLGTISVVAYSRIKAGADKDATRALISQVENAVELYQVAINKYPDTEHGLNALIAPPDDENEARIWRDKGGPFLKDGKIPLDPWRKEIKYQAMELSGSSLSVKPFHIWSVGPDGQDGTDDDIRNW